jgi:hypothetical protein
MTDISMPVVTDEEYLTALAGIEEERKKMGVAERLQGGGEIPWIPDPAKAEQYGKPSCQLNPLIGNAVNHYRRDNFRQDGQYDVIVLLVENVGEVAVHCQPIVLANQMRAAKPKPGEEVGCQFIGMQKSASGTEYANYKVVVDRAVEGDFDWADQGEPTSYEIVTHTPAAPTTVTVQPTQAPVAVSPRNMDEIPFIYTIF